MIRGFYIKDYDEVDLGYSEYLLADSHGTPLGDFTEIHDVHNFSGQSDSYLDMERKLKYLIRNTTVKKIYISVDDHTLSPTRENQNNLDRSAYYTEKGDFPSYQEFIHDKYLQYYCVFLNDRYSLVIKNFIQYELFNFSKWGGVRSKSSWEDLSFVEQVEISQDRIDNYFEFSFPSVKMSNSLRRIISICKAEDIELIGLRFPLTKTYVDILDNESYDADSVLINNNLPIVDFDSLFLEQDYLFRDMDHLDRDGGEKFAKILFDSLEDKVVL
ncbi:hypothetical protein [Algoriphagus sp. D3-2-R+10]|uniref:hypothetical protein n=1 Tax=Algoriphagus aurantiacus TaxID=3103948 RepID=UPI002B4092F4|nr:hypothetical protein [Algoriphagus sp. D3-2-R+10]